MTSDTWREVKILSKFQVPSQYGLGVKVERIFGGKGRVNESMNYEVVCRTAPASPALLNTISAIHPMGLGPMGLFGWVK